MTFDDSMDDEVKVTIIATGFEEQSKEQILKAPKRDMLGRSTRESENFITRLTKQEANMDDDEENEEPKAPAEDLETPAFLRRSIKNTDNKSK
jgi:cell division GTPase FtsZ